MFADNFFNKDPTHIILAKYFLKQDVLVGKNTYVFNSFITFKCKPIEPRANCYTTSNKGFERVAPDTVLIETKWAGINYTVGDYVEYRQVNYQIKSIKKDETRVHPQVLMLFNGNPNTYYILELEEVNVLDLQNKGDNNNVK